MCARFSEAGLKGVRGLVREDEAIASHSSCWVSSTLDYDPRPTADPWRPTAGQSNQPSATTLEIPDDRSARCSTSHTAWPRATIDPRPAPQTEIRTKLTSTHDHHQPNQRQCRLDLALVLLLKFIGFRDWVGRASTLGNLLVVLLKRATRLGSALKILVSSTCTCQSGSLSNEGNRWCSLRAA